MISVARGMLLDVNLLCKSAKILCLAKQRERVVKQASESWLQAGLRQSDSESLAIVWSGILFVVSPTQILSGSLQHAFSGRSSAIGKYVFCAT
jgi:hypothetical protein